VCADRAAGQVWTGRAVGSGVDRCGQVVPRVKCGINTGHSPLGHRYVGMPDMNVNAQHVTRKTASGKKRKYIVKCEMLHRLLSSNSLVDTLGVTYDASDQCQVSRIHRFRPCPPQGPPQGPRHSDDEFSVRGHAVIGWQVLVLIYYDTGRVCCRLMRHS
jgi:hypothetical protein